MEEFKKNPNTPMQEIDLVHQDCGSKLDGIRIDLSKMPKREDDDGQSGKGWTVTATARLDNPNAAKQLKRMLFGEGRLPRKEKKRHMNMVLRDQKVLMFVSALMYNNSIHVLSVLTSLMFPEKIRSTTEQGLYVVMPTPAQQRIVGLCMKRIPKQAIKTFRKYRKELEEDLTELEAHISKDSE